jgi:hypothetical protein
MERVLRRAIAIMRRVPTGWPRRLRAAGLAVAVVGCSLGGSALAVPPPPLPAGLSPGARAKVEQVAMGADVAARGEAKPFLTRRPVFEYLLDHPDFATHVTRALKLERIRIWRSEDGYELDDGWGVTGRFWILHTADGVRVMRARGQYKKGFLPAIAGDAAIVIEYGHTPHASGRILVSSAVSGFVKLDSRLLAGGLRLASGLSQKKADKDAQNLMKVFAKVSKAIETSPASVYDKVRQQPGVPARELEEFARLLSLR